MELNELPTIEVELVKESKIASVDFNDLPFGKTFSDHMFIAEYYDGKWQSAKVQPYKEIALSPACNVFHYGQAIFEGLKAYYKADGSGIVLFRPEKNAARLNASAKRMSMPEVPVELFMDGIRHLLEVDNSFVPKQTGSSLYIRPFLIGTEPFIGVRSSDRYLFIIITGPTGAYYDEAISVLVYDSYVRSTKGGYGNAKAAGNYAGTLYPVKLAKEKGYKDVLWLDGEHKKYINEVGTMNIFFVIDGKLVTPETDGTILDGVTRDSVITIAKDLGIDVEERQISIDEIVDAYNAGKLTEIFGSGTAAVISPVNKFGYKEKDYPLDETKYVVAQKIKENLVGIQKCMLEDKFNWVTQVN
ncbi:MAG: branched-chain amino acid aminotransferase [Bacteroidetes bacterium]|nr:branched-chain amino acid aminotransferase [Bacteroidota bacterium]